MKWFDDPARIDVSLDSRAVSFENPAGAKGAGGTAHRGRKGSPKRLLMPGDKVVLADIKGPGRIRHFWMTFEPMPPEEMRAVWMEVYYDNLKEPSISVPCLDFFGLPHGRPVHLETALTSVQQGRGFNAYYPIPFSKWIRVELTNGSSRPINLYYQINYTLEPEFPCDCGYLHVAFRRENPTALKNDFVLAEGFTGPGRFLGSVVGIRVLKDDMIWYGEGEMKVYLDGDTDYPTICGTGLEDYVGSAWGMEAHTTKYQGVPIMLMSPETTVMAPLPDLVSLYRWHIPDPIIFRENIKVTIQQIGALIVPKGQEHLVDEYSERYEIAGEGWTFAADLPGSGNALFHAIGIAERRDDYSVAGFVYCTTPQSVPRINVKQAVSDIERRDYEQPTPLEMMMAQSSEF